MNRRGILIGIAAAALVPRVANAQSFKVAPPNGLYHALKTPQQADALALSVSALRTLLLLELSRSQNSDDGSLWQKDRGEFLKLLEPLRNVEARATVSRLLETLDQRAVAPAINERALPAAQRYEKILHQGGLAAGSPLSSDLLNSFLHFNRFLVAYLPDGQSWYCRIYPFSVAC